MPFVGALGGGHVRVTCAERLSLFTLQPGAAGGAGNNHRQSQHKTGRYTRFNDYLVPWLNRRKHPQRGKRHPHKARIAASNLGYGDLTNSDTPEEAD
ncbi:MAG: hypothetical protein ACRD3Q_15505 [Terriglobales bacterium]